MGLSNRFKRVENVVETQMIPESLPEVEEVFEDSFIEEIENEITYGAEAVDQLDFVTFSNLQQFINDKSVYKIVVTGNVAKIFRDERSEEKITIHPEELNAFVPNKSFFQYVTNGWIVAGVKEPIAQTPCITFDKINRYLPAQLVQKNIYSEKCIDFIIKSVLAKKNILLTCNDNSMLLNTSHIIKEREMVLLYDLEKVEIEHSSIALNLQNLSSEELECALNVAINMGPEYLVADVDEFKTGKLVAKTHDLTGKIYSLPSVSAQRGLHKLQNLIMTEEYCNEKIAKSKILNSFDYIIDQNSVYVISPAKTAILTLRELPA